MSYVVKQTITQGCNDGATLSFRFPADPDRFTDLNSTMFRLTVSVTMPDGTYPNFAGGVHQEVWLDPQGMHSLFSSVEVRFNDEVVSTMTMYPFTTALVRCLGMSRDLKTDVWDVLDGTHNHIERELAFWPTS